MENTHFQKKSNGFLEVKFNDLTNDRKLKGKQYKFIFGQHYIPGDLGHFITKVKINIKDHITIDDIDGNAALAENKILFNLRILVFLSKL